MVDNSAKLLVEHLAEKLAYQSGIKKECSKVVKMVAPKGQLLVDESDANLDRKSEEMKDVR